MPDIRILIIDDHDLYRAGLRAALKAGMPDADFLEAGSIHEATQAPPDGVDVIVLDFRLPGLNGAEGIALLRRNWPQAPVLMLSAQNDPDTVRLALERGAAGFASKADPADSIVAAIRRMSCGQFPATQPEPGKSLIRLSPRQREVLDLLSQGLPNKQIAKRLALSEHTVRVYLQGIFGFLQVSSRAEAIVAARSRGLIG